MQDAFSFFLFFFTVFLLARQSTLEKYENNPSLASSACVFQLFVTTWSTNTASKSFNTFSNCFDDGNCYCRAVSEV